MGFSPIHGLNLGSRRGQQPRSQSHHPENLKNEAMLMADTARTGARRYSRIKNCSASFEATVEMAIRRSNQLASVVTRVRIASQTGLKKGACSGVIAMILSSGLACICCATATSDICCRSVQADGSNIIASVISAKGEDHRCHDHKQQRIEGEKRCCIRGPQPNSQATLSQLVDLRAAASCSDSMPTSFGVGQPSEFTRRAPVMNRGSTYLLCCVLRI